MLKINKEKNADTLVIALEGELNMITSKTLEEALQIDNCNRLVFECSKLAYITSAGIRVFVAANKNMKAKGGSVVLSNANEAVMEVLRLTGINKIVNVE